MRLLNVETFQLEEFFESDLPDYYILSHRWEDAEISFQEFTTLSPTALKVKKKKPWAKLMGFIDICKKGQVEYGWVDTFCIDKSSSAELSEAINSMFRWYKKSRICVAYLNDVSSTSEEVTEDFGDSEWFTRGWTLQELLAPRELRFFNNDWTFIGEKWGLRKLIAEATGIDEGIVAGENWERKSVATRMKWAAMRSTTRVEDIAYCLLGIFDINMPLLYGEGEKAFIRLQEAIMEQFGNDHSIFLWSPSQQLLGVRYKIFRGAQFARCPSWFSDVPSHDLLKISPEPTVFTKRWMQLPMRLQQASKCSLREELNRQLLDILGADDMLQDPSFVFGMASIAYIDMSAFYLAIPFVRVGDSNKFQRVHLPPVLIDLESVESPIAEQSILLDNTDMSSDVYYMNQLRDIFKDTGLSSIAIELPKKKCLRLVSIWPREEDQESSSLAIYKPAVDLNIIELEYARSGEVGDRIYLFLQLKVPIQVASSRGNAVPEMLTAMLAAVQLQERKLWQNSFSVGFGLPYSQRVMFRNWARTIRNEDADEAWFAVGGEELVVKLTRMELKDGWLGKCRITEFGPQHRHRLPKSRTRDAAGLTWFEPLVKENADL